MKLSFKQQYLGLRIGILGLICAQFLFWGSRLFDPSEILGSSTLNTNYIVFNLFAVVMVIFSVILVFLINIAYTLIGWFLYLHL